MKLPTSPFARFAWLVITVLLVTACGSGAREIRGELPLVRLESLEVDDQHVILAVGLRNINDRSLMLRRLATRVMVEGQLLLDTEAAFQIDISARGREVVRLEATGQAAGLAVLAERFGPTTGTDRALANAAWTMELTLVDARERQSDSQVQGFLHPVPGRPGQFR
ncbi:MAG: hypothetical protein ACLFSC_00105 [Wenzhouxiangella sp.]